MFNDLSYASGVDVVVRLHDPRRHIEFETALFSLFNQSFKPVHVVVVTQSFDREATEKAQASIDSLDWFVQGHHLPTLANVEAPVGQDVRAKLLNVGISFAHNRYLAFLDGDDYLYGHAYDHLVAHAVGSGAALTFGNIVCKHVRVFDDFVYTSKTMKDVFRGSGLTDLLTDNFCPIHSFLVDRAQIPAREITFNEDLCRLEDYDFLLRLCSKYPTHFESRDAVVGVYNWHLDGRGTTQFAQADSVKAAANQRAWNDARRHIWRLKTELRSQYAGPVSGLPAATAAQTAPIAAAEVPEIPLLFPIGHFYSPIVNPEDLRSRCAHLWARTDIVEGVDLDPPAQLALLRNLERYAPASEYPIENPGDERTYFYKNDQYPVLDADFLHAALAFFRPKIVIEVGCGFSSLITAKVNREILGCQIDFTCIEPYPRQFLADGIDGVSRLLRSKVEDVDLAFFDRLGANDILFIDSSHVSKAGSDVNYLLFYVLPRLKPGVLIHFHDIFLPDEYPQKWVLDEGRNWNEQYLLRAFLQFNPNFSVVWAAHFMGTRHAQAVQSVFPRYPELGGGGSFWIRKTR